MAFDLYCLFIYFSSVRRFHAVVYADVQSKQTEFKQIRLRDCNSGIYIVKHYRLNGNLLLSIVVMVSILRFRATPKDSEPCYWWCFVLRSSNTCSQMKLRVSNGITTPLKTEAVLLKQHKRHIQRILTAIFHVVWFVLEPFVLITKQLIGVCLWCTDFVHPFRNVRTILSPHKSSPLPFQTPGNSGNS